MADNDLIRRLRSLESTTPVWDAEDKKTLRDAVTALERHAVPREPSEKMIAAAQVLVMAASFPGAKAPLLKDLWQAMYDAAVVPANPRPATEKQMRHWVLRGCDPNIDPAKIGHQAGVSGGKAESDQTPEQAKDAAVATTQELMLDGIRPLSMRKLETDACVVCGCQIAKGEKLCGECACEEDGP